MTSAPTDRLPVPASDGAAGLTSAEVHAVASADDDAIRPTPAGPTRPSGSSGRRRPTNAASPRCPPCSPTTVRASRAAIGHAHRAAGLADPTGHIGVRRVLQAAY